MKKSVVFQGNKLSWKGMNVSDVRVVNDTGADILKTWDGMGFTTGTVFFVLVLSFNKKFQATNPDANIAVDNGTGIADLMPVTFLNKDAIVKGSDSLNLI